MKKQLLLIAIVLAFAAASSFYPPSLYADDGECTNVISFGPVETDNVNNTIHSFDIHDTVCELDFPQTVIKISDDNVVSLDNFDGTFTFTMSANETDDITIKGLNLEVTDANLNGQPLLTIVNKSPTARVILDGVNLSGAPNLLKMDGDGQIEVINSKFEGDSSLEGACVDVASNNAIVKSSEISSCKEGIRISADEALIGAENAFGYDEEKNLIHDNEIGIHVVSGKKNHMAFNAIYDDNSMCEASANSGNPLSIVSEKDSDDGKPPIVLKCLQDESGKIVTWQLRFNVPAEGDIMLYATKNTNTKSLRTDIPLATCHVLTTGVCDIPLADLKKKAIKLGGESLQFSDDECGVDKLHGVVAFDDGINATEFLLDTIRLDAGIKGSITATPFEPPIAINGIGSDTGTVPTGSKGGAETGSDPSTSTLGGGAGAGGSCMGQLAPSNPQRTSYGFLILLIPVLLLGAFRFRREDGK